MFPGVFEYLCIQLNDKNKTIKEIAIAIPAYKKLNLNNILLFAQVFVSNIPKNANIPIIAANKQFIIYDTKK
jgi:hypothetical protein